MKEDKKKGDLDYLVMWIQEKIIEHTDFPDKKFISNQRLSIILGSYLRYPTKPLNIQRKVQNLLEKRNCIRRFDQRKFEIIPVYT